MGKSLKEKACHRKPHKVKNLHELENHLETPTQLRRFLGAVNEYRKFIKDLALLAEPFYEALRKNGEKDPVKIKQAAREILQKLENSKPLKLPQNNVIYFLETDASDYAYGAVLKQDDRPVLFLSNTFNTTQRNYSTGDKEKLGIVMAVKKLKYYLFGNKTII